MKVTFRDLAPGGTAAGAGRTYEGTDELAVVRALKADNPFQAELADDAFIQAFRARVEALLGVRLVVAGSPEEQARSLIQQLQKARLVVVEE